jgi:predicted house-cleaning noncanonical NTP pyrophosphatase (MazG superfamily)
LPEIIRRSNQAKLVQRSIHEAAAKELEAKLAEIEFQAVKTREKLMRARRILRKK